MSNIIYTEKYRPKDIELMSLDKYNKLFINNILSMDNFPNLIFYGPPGTGKTTTIINLINKFLEKKNMKNKGLVMHYNASDDRGIQLIRNTILNFISSNGVLSNEVKFIVLDEADYMTKQAQILLKKILEDFYENVRICLICNYICKIHTSLLSEFVIMKFCNIDTRLVFDILKNISEKEDINISDVNINNIIKYYDTDIRSMINYLQHSIGNIFDESEYNRLRQKICLLEHDELVSEIEFRILTNNISLDEYIKKFIDYFINTSDRITNDFIFFAENIYLLDYDLHYVVHYLKCNKYLFEM